jgi:precorrin-6B methylase 1
VISLANSGQYENGRKFFAFATHTGVSIAQKFHDKLQEELIVRTSIFVYEPLGLENSRIHAGDIRAKSAQSQFCLMADMHVLHQGVIFLTFWLRTKASKRAS